MAETRTVYYSSFTDDVVESSEQNLVLPENYKWIRKGFGQKFLYFFVYLLVLPVAIFYSKFCIHASVYGRKNLKKAGRKGYVIYANHTQPVGDAFMPAWICRPRHIYVVVAAANLGIPVLGKILTYLGGLPVPAKLSQFGKFNSAIAERLNQKQCLIVYPEAHVWPYYTGIRPFNPVSFAYPVDNDVPVFTMTTTYYKRKHGDKPGIKVYVDGPFYADKKESKKIQRQKLAETVSAKMKERSSLSSYCYINYVEGKDK